MDKKKMFLAGQSVLCVLIVLLLIVSTIGIYRQGLARKAADPLSAIYTREKAAEVLLPVLPLIFLSLGMTAAGLSLKIKDEKAMKPVKNTNLPRGRTRDGCTSAVMGKNPESAGMKKLRKAILVLSLFLIVAGAFNGSARDVLGKAIKICTECIGLG